MNINISNSEKYYIRIFSLGIGILIVLLGIFASISYGAADIPIAKILTAFINYDDSTEHIIIRSMRLPRTLIASMVGASLAIAGALMQGLTQNPLAAPGILGINAGAALAVVTVVFGLGTSSAPLITLVAFIGALIAALAVYSLGSLGQGGSTSLNLTIAGAALTALLSSITTGILILSDRTLEEVRFWLAGSLAGRDFNLFLTVLPWMVVGLLTAFALSRQINVLSLGESIATGLGQQTGWIKLATASSVVILAGSAVALAGPIGFVGLLVPHLARGVMGVDYRWILPGAAVFGAGLLVWADLAARWLIRPQELPVGVMTALLGAPFLLYLVRWQVKRG
ncbi:FecCD family ABC transporter permease [Nostoc sp. PA-18-2419]|uniref:FecCD family ABC transporter permease n=1 Tax=Nostoc sp. PA-18-2419 TaxID=2575443 RepID=UPI001108E1FD|nr:iron ABC transporter permease [Nostoc sp. PA-18-2419]